ncbi:MAG: histidine kinase [Clostridia bacterium]|nr:histidine kinase [Clostridia bacterium]
MTDWSPIFYFSIISSALMLSLLGLWFAATMPGIGRWNKRFFVYFFIALLLCCVSGLADTILSNFYITSTVLYSCVVFLECLILSLPLLMQTVYLLHSSGESIRSNWLFRTVFGLWAAYCVLLAVVSYRTVFTFQPMDNQYYRMPQYLLMLLALVAIQALNFAATIRYRARLTHKVFLGFSFALLPMTVGLILQMFIDVFPLIDIAYIISALVMYSFALSDQVEQDLRRQREIANQRASIMVLQMRPHFIYNTMTSVYCLCKQNPDQAQKVILDFTTYLRKNFTAIASETPIPFSAELEHTRAYLAVEQAQYEESLFVDYDTPHTMFRVPPLTLQPIVENAVKHGRDPYAGPFHISIRTRKTESASEIIVADDGVGFQPADGSEPHLALKNIQERLEMMCGGSLAIASNDGGGTVVTVTIPDGRANG